MPLAMPSSFYFRWMISAHVVETIHHLLEHIFCLVLQGVGLNGSIVHRQTDGNRIVAVRFRDADDVEQRFCHFYHLLLGSFRMDPVPMDDTGHFFPTACAAIHLSRFSSETLILFRTVPLICTGFISSIIVIAVLLATPILSDTCVGLSQMVMRCSSPTQSHPCDSGHKQDSRCTREGVVSAGETGILCRLLSAGSS